MSFQTRKISVHPQMKIFLM